MSITISAPRLIPTFRRGTDCSAYPVSTVASEVGCIAPPESLGVYPDSLVDRSGPGPDPAASSSPYPAPTFVFRALASTARSLGVRPPFRPGASRIEPGSKSAGIL